MLKDKHTVTVYPKWVYNCTEGDADCTPNSFDSSTVPKGKFQSVKAFSVSWKDCSSEVDSAVWTLAGGLQSDNCYAVAENPKYRCPSWKSASGASAADECPVACCGYESDTRRKLQGDPSLVQKLKIRPPLASQPEEPLASTAIFVVLLGLLLPASVALVVAHGRRSRSEKGLRASLARRATLAMDAGPKRDSNRVAPPHLVAAYCAGLLDATCETLPIDELTDIVKALEKANTQVV